MERVRGVVRKCNELRAERRVKGFVREDMVVFVFSFWVVDV